MGKFKRELSSRLRKAARQFSAVILTGPRRAGKTHLLRHCFPRASYHLLESPDVLARVKEDPRGWLESLALPAIVDEVQNAPELFPWIRSFIDAQPRATGRWLLTGSHDYSLMANATESMASRAAVFQLLPLSFRELGRWNLLRGSYPEVWLRPSAAATWFESYLQTYVERDVRQVHAVKDLLTFRRFVSLVASRHGQVLNRSDLAAPLGISVPTVSQWLSTLEVTGLIALIPPYFENFGKRLTKSPKLYWLDSGLVCHLLGISTPGQLERSPFLGPVFEGFVAAELIKNQINLGRRRELYYFRDERGLEVDFVEPAPGGKLRLLEVKWAKTVMPVDAKSMKELQRVMGGERAQGIVVHRSPKTGPGTEVVTAGVSAQGLETFLRASGLRA